MKIFMLVFGSNVGYFVKTRGNKQRSHRSRVAFEKSICTRKDAYLDISIATRRFS